MSIRSYKTDHSSQESCTTFQCPIYYYSAHLQEMSSLPSERGSHTLSTRSSSGRSTPKYNTSLDLSFKEGRGDPQFPSIEMQMGMINGMNVQDSSKNFNSIIGKIRMLEDENTVTKKRNQCLFLEKEMEVKKRIKFESRVAELERALQEEQAKTQPERDISCTKDAETSPINSICSDEGVQVWTVCRACKRELQSQENKEPVITMTKSELEKLEKDMMVLRDNVLSTEEGLERAKNREQNYREQIARLFVEADSARTLCKTRLEEIRTLAQALSDKELEAKNLEKKMKDMGKLIIKLNKQRNIEETCQLENKFIAEISEKEQKWIEDIERRLRSTNNKTKNKR
ncbi:uncharacterized protein LOC117176761 [Belonocnema kinseyi]|uniref:uncharacterized protein LOC117176761 n=1 Tax=Belonocnema kinseyi TaxID=2817044 RepID=UPI00143CE2F9|nr:uncharacterized protein LOC117176761 [Belonocnema kinseyi]